MIWEKRKKHLATLCAMSLLAAISIVCGKYLAIGVGEVLRFSFENLPILLAGILFGPVAGGVVGVLADLIGCLLVGYGINPFAMAGAALIGVLSGILWRIFVRLETLSLPFCVILTVPVTHLIASVGVKTPGLSMWYDFPLGELYLWRLLNYAIIAAVECILLSVLVRNKTFVGAVTSAFGSLSILREGKK